MNVFDFLATTIVCIFAMVTIVSCSVARSHAKVKIAEAQAARTVIHVNAKTGEVQEQTVDPDANVTDIGVNQTGKWAGETA